MKQIFLFILLALTISAQITKEEIYHNSDKELYFYGASLDSGITTSPLFELSQFNGNSFLSYPLIFTYETEALTGSAIYAIYIERKFTNHAAEVIDTIAVNDTAAVGITSGTLDLNNMKSAEYRIKVVTTSSEGALFRLKLTLYAYKED